MIPSSSVTFLIQQLFPREDYRAACRKNKELTPLYLIALKQPTKIILAQYEESKRDPNYVEPCFKLTALAVATLMGRYDVMQYLLGKGVKQDPVDKGGLTPLHYVCALRDVKSMELLGESRKVEEVFPGWLEMLNPSIPTGSAEVTYRNGSPVTADQFKALTGAQYYEGVIASPQQFVNLLAKRVMEKTPDPLNDLFVAQFQGPRPKLFIGSQGKAGEGLFARENIPAGRILSVYGGDVDVSFGSAPKGNTDYVFMEFDGTRVRSHATLANDGFPTACFQPIYHPDGRVYNALFALVPLEKGDPIFVNYGYQHEIKVKAVREELNAKAMENYFNKNPPSVLISRLKKSPLVWGKNYDIPYRLEYLLCTPSALFSLFLKGILSKEECSLLQREETFKLVNAVDYSVLLGECQTVYGQIEKLDPLINERDELKKILLGLIQTSPFHAVLHVCGCLNFPSIPGVGFPSWEDEFHLYPTLMNEIAYFGSLQELSSVDEIDIETFKAASKKLSQAPRLKLYIPLFLTKMGLFEKLKKHYFQV